MPYKDKTRELEYQRIWQASKRKKQPTFNMYHLAKMRAKRKGVEFSIKQEDILIPSHCPVFGTPMHFGGKRNDAPSLDRVNLLKGYTKDNICVISNRANQLKSSSTLNDLEEIVTYVKDHNESCG